MEDQAGAVDAQVGEEGRAGGVEGHLDRQAAARGARCGGGVGKVGDVAPQVEEDGAVVIVALGKGRRDPGGGGHGEGERRGVRNRIERNPETNNS